MLYCQLESLFNNWQLPIATRHFVTSTLTASPLSLFWLTKKSLHLYVCLTGDLVSVVLHQFLDVEEEISEKRGTLLLKEVFG